MRGIPQPLIALLALLLAIPSFVVAQTTPTRGFSVVADDAQNRPIEVQLYRKMVAVVIGIDRYADPSMNLSYAVKDAQGMEEVLRDAYGFDPVTRSTTRTRRRPKSSNCSRRACPAKRGKTTPCSCSSRDTV